MKRRISILMAFCLLLSCVLSVSVGAEQGEALPAWAEVSYRAVVAEGEEPGEAVALRTDQREKITGSVEILFDAAVSVVELNTKRIEPGKTITVAGLYSVKVFDAATYVENGVNNTYYTYTIQYDPNIVVHNGESEALLVSGSVYQFYPTLYCDNASKIEIKKGTNTKAYNSGDAWPYPGEFGEYSIVVFGQGTGGGLVEIKTYVFKVYPCVASTSYDEALGVYALKITTGRFDGVSYLLDGKEILPDNTTKVITAVGEHTLDLLVEGERIDRDLYFYYGMPSAETLALRIDVTLDSDVWDLPRRLDFSKWDAVIELDGEIVSEIYIDGHGEHVIRVLDSNGNAVDNCFLLTVGDAAPVVTGQVNVTFDNPHFLYVIFMLIPAALLLIAAVCFLVLRRIVV